MTLYIQANDLHTQLQEGLSFTDALVSAAVTTFERNRQPGEKSDGFGVVISALVHKSQLVLLLDDLESVPPPAVAKFLSDLATAQKELSTLPSEEDRLFLHRIVCTSRSVAFNRQPADSRLIYLLLSSKIKKEEEKVAFLESVIGKRSMDKTVVSHVENPFKLEVQG